jgi:poly-beta-hydroxybutyrate-responsive repressor
MTTFELDRSASGLPRQTLRFSLLVLLAEGHAHGYELLDQVDELGHRHVDPGGCYRSLRAMEQEGLVFSWWEPSQSGPARRTYALTDEGRDWTHLWAAALAESHRRMAALLERYRTLQARPEVTP